MATTQNTFTGNGSNLGPFSFTFKWLEPTDIKVTVAGVLKTVGTHYNLQSLNYSTKTGGQVLFTAGNAPANGAAIVIYRQTDDTDLAATFSSGSAIRAQDLNSNFTQGLYVAQEVNNSVVTANTTANTALTNSNTAISTANTASTNASAAVATANTASANASAAVSTANTASANATTAVNTANSAAAAVANVVTYTIIANVAAIPATPANNTAVEVTNSTGIQSFTPLSGVPVGFVGSAGLSVRIIYSTVGSTWNWVQYFPNDPEARYLKLAGGNITGSLGINNPTPAYALDVASSVAQVGAATDAFIQYKSTAGNWHVGAVNSNAYVFYSGTYGGGTERARIDSSGRLLVGTSTARSNFFNAAASAALQLEGTGANRRAAIIGDDFEGSLILASQKSGAVGGNTVLASGDPIGAVSFQGNDGSEFVEAATITAQVDGTPGANDMPGRLVFSTTADGASSPTERMRISSAGTTTLTSAASTAPFIANIGASEAARIDSSGRLLVGTSSGAAKLEVFTASDGDGIRLDYGNTPTGSAGPAIAFAQYNNASSGITTSSIKGIMTNGAVGGEAGALVFNTATGGTAPTERMRINNAGLVAINTAAKYDSYAVSLAVAGAYPNTPVEIQQNSTTAHFAITFRNSNGLVGDITTNGSATAFNTSSDYRLKENVVPLTGAADRLNQLQVHRFNFIADPDKTVDGFIAHEAQAVVPECVTGEKDAADADGNPIYQGIDQSKLVPLLTAALQEALAEIESLKARVTALEP
jgi:hypothetical protein